MGKKTPILRGKRARVTFWLSWVKWCWSLILSVKKYPKLKFSHNATYALEWNTCPIISSPDMHSENYYISKEVESLLSNKLGNLLPTWRVTSITVILYEFNKKNAVQAEFIYWTMTLQSNTCSMEIPGWFNGFYRECIVLSMHEDSMFYNYGWLPSLSDLFIGTQLLHFPDGLNNWERNHILSLLHRLYNSTKNLFLNNTESTSHWKWLSSKCQLHCVVILSCSNHWESVVKILQSSNLPQTIHSR